MIRTKAADQLRDDAIEIWNAGVEAVKPRRLFQHRFQFEPSNDGFVCGVRGENLLELGNNGQLFVFGAGKAGAAMAEAVETTVLEAGFSRDRLAGWVNVPDGFTQRLECVHLHGARPVGRNEPTQRAIEGTRAILGSIERLSPFDMGICLISGGGSALLCDPVDGITLEDKQATTRLLSELGASIHQLNCVRKHLSRVKGGGLARRFRGGTLLTLILSDVLGDPVETIASGPTVPQESDPVAALAVIREFDPAGCRFPDAVVRCLKSLLEGAVESPSSGSERPCRAATHIIGNNDLATEACRKAGERLGYEVGVLPVDVGEGSADETGSRLATDIDRMVASGGKRCLISGGEPVVQLADKATRGLGGRNQQVVLAATVERFERLSASDSTPCFAILSGGTDGEDGPTDAAGACITDKWLIQNRDAQVEAQQALQNNDAYHYFDSRGGLLITGPTQTNVCDIRVVLVDS